MAVFVPNLTLLDLAKFVADVVDVALEIVGKEIVLMRWGGASLNHTSLPEDCWHLLQVAADACSAR